MDENFVCKQLVHRIEFSVEVMRPNSIWQKASRRDIFLHPQKLMELALHWQHTQELHGVLDTGSEQRAIEPVAFAPPRYAP